MSIDRFDQIKIKQNIKYSYYTLWFKKYALNEHLRATRGICGKFKFTWTMYFVFTQGNGFAITLTNEMYILVPVKEMSTENPMGKFPLPNSKQIQINNANTFYFLH